jgi:hypothetical protein
LRELSPFRFGKEKLERIATVTLAFEFTAASLIRPVKLFIG